MLFYRNPYNSILWQAWHSKDENKRETNTENQNRVMMTLEKESSTCLQNNSTLLWLRSQVDSPLDDSLR